MPKLRTITPYRNPPRGLAYEAGVVIEVDEALASFLQADSPDAFEVVKAPASPPAHKAILDAPERKAAADDLTVISGISRAKARQLAALGIATFAALAAADAATLTQIRGVGDTTAHEWILAAKERL